MLNEPTDREEVIIRGLTRPVIVGYCPSCGKEAKLNEYTGWCDKCQPVCSNCGRPSKTRLCSNCYDLEFRAEHQELFADYLEQGLTVVEAEKRVRQDVRPICLSCKSPMPRARKDSCICRRNPACIKVYNVYVKLSKRGVQKEDALLQALVRFAYDDRIREVA